MVTSPDLYPVWKTRNPVVVALPAPHASVSSLEDMATDESLLEMYHHRYRYMVVTPGADGLTALSSPKSSCFQPIQNKKPSSGSVVMSAASSDDNARSNRNDTATPPLSRSPTPTREFTLGLMREDSLHSTGSNSNAASASAFATNNADTEECCPMALWEDPFADNGNENSLSRSESFASDSTPIRGPSGGGKEVHRRDVSSGVVNRSCGVGSMKYLLNLPFRTLDIPLTQGSAGWNKGADDISERTDEGIRVDQWNNPEEESWRPYLERLEQTRKQKAHAFEKSFSQDSNNQDEDYDEDEEMLEIENKMYKNMTSSDYDDEDLEDMKFLSTSEAEEEDLEGNAKNQTKSTEKLFLVCYHLPVILSYNNDANDNDQNWTATWSESLISKTENSIAGIHDTYWIGTVSLPPSYNLPLTAGHKEEIIQVLGKMKCMPIFIDKETKDAHYLGMCKQVLWPSFHNIDLLDLSTSGWGRKEISQTSDNANNNVRESSSESNWDQSRLDGWWQAYSTVNRHFANICVEYVQPGDIVWVHDYHLALLPKMLDMGMAEKYSSTLSDTHDNAAAIIKMVFFLHIPFPTSQIFRELECGESILEGMLHANVIGFHAFDHARHFLNAAKRILGLSYESLTGGLIGVRFGGKTVLVTLSNVSVEPNTVDATLALPSVKEMSQVIKEKYPHRQVIAGVDTAQRLSGISLKLLAYERLLTDYHTWQHRVVMIQKCLIPGTRRVDEMSTLRELRFLVKRIKEKFGPHVIDYEEIPISEYKIEQRLALWLTSDVLVVAPVREGLNLLPLEYIYARKSIDDDHGGSKYHTVEQKVGAGVVLASEFSAVSNILNGALRVNPFDIQMFSTSLEKSLRMEKEEREGRRARDIDFVSSCPSAKWTKNVLRDLNEATASPSEDEDCLSAAENTIAGFLARESERHFSYMDRESIHAAYQATSRRVFIMDFNGTLVIKEPPGKYLKREILGTSGFKPPALVIKALADLCADPRNLVFVVSGDSQENVEKAIGNIPGLYLAASNGACFALPLQPGETNRKWHCFDLGVNWKEVKDVALPLLSKYTARTNGSFVKLTHSSIGWSNYSCDPEWGQLQASHLVLELEHALSKFDVRFVTLKGVTEIVPRRLNKGLIVKKVLRAMAAQNGGDGVDFVLCMGDDISDEKMFTSVFSFLEEMDEEYSNVIPSPPVITQDNSNMNDFLMQEVPSLKCKNSMEPIFAFTVAVGKKPSYASQYVDDARDVSALLVSLTGGDLSSLSGRGMSFDLEEGIDIFA